MDFDNHSQFCCFKPWESVLIRLVFLSSLGFFISPVQATTGSNWNKQAAKVCSSLNEIPALVASGKNMEAKGKLDDTYFVEFENFDANFEAEIRTQISRDAAAEIESKFSEIRKSIIKKLNSKDLQTHLDRLCADLKSLALKLKEKKTR